MLFAAVCLLGLCGLFTSQVMAEATDATARMKSWEYHVKLKNESIFQDLKWRAVGPTYQGGRIENIACPAGYTSTIYAAVGSGNLWKTTNNGTTWKPIFEHESAFAVGAIDVARTDPDILWVGTGEILLARSSFAGTGVFKSVDGGQTWENMGLNDTHHIGKVIIDPKDPDIVYVAAIGRMYSYNEERGLFKTTDGGKTWEKVLYVSEKVGVVDIAMDPTDNQTLYAVTWEHDRKAWNHIESGADSGIHKSTDAGRTWKRLTNGLPQGKDIGRIGLAIAPTNPNIIYALVDNNALRPEGKKSIGGEVFRSEDKGRNWKKVNEDHLPVPIGYGFCIIRVSPDNEDQVYILSTYLLTSNDGGRTYSKNHGQIINLLPHDSKVLHLDHHAMWIDPLNPDRIISGTDGGLYMSYDRGKTWLRVNNIPAAEVYALTVDMADPYNIYIGTQDNAAIFGPSTHTIGDGVPDPWKHVYLDQWGGGDSYFTWVDPTDRDTIYYEQQFGHLKRKNMKDSTTKTISPKAEKGQSKLRYNWMTPFIISHYNPYTLYCGSNKIFKSINRGDNWVRISDDLSTQPGPEKQGNVPYGTITMIAESPVKQGLLYVGTDDGNVQVTRDDGASWKEVSVGLPDKWVSRVEASMFDEGTVYVTLTGYRENDFSTYVYMSTDHGENWVSIAGNLPDEPVNVIRQDPRDCNILYVGTDSGGVYVTLDAGKKWHSLCSDLPTVAVHDMAVHPREHELVIGTHGRSVFVMDVKSIQNRSESEKDK